MLIFSSLQFFYNKYFKKLITYVNYTTWRRIWPFELTAHAYAIYNLRMRTRNRNQPIVADFLKNNLFWPITCLILRLEKHRPHQTVLHSIFILIRILDDANRVYNIDYLCPTNPVAAITESCQTPAGKTHEIQYILTDYSLNNISRKK